MAPKLKHDEEHFYLDVIGSLSAIETRARVVGHCIHDPEVLQLIVEIHMLARQQRQSTIARMNGRKTGEL